MKIKNDKTWYVYMLRCSDDTLYTGITTNLGRRINEHNEGKSGAKYTRARRPVELVYSESLHGRQLASKREVELKNFTKSEKEKILTDYRYSAIV
ncbi:MAG: GIY-YIG nuclease family protein [Candidatus Nomurabacteria bacterium]|nr:MAG: GIY-YIG nuclease family protein [Candidatus Nomurabacteria bacterium]